MAVEPGLLSRLCLGLALSRCTVEIFAFHASLPPFWPVLPSLFAPCSDRLQSWSLQHVLSAHIVPEVIEDSLQQQMTWFNFYDVPPPHSIVLVIGDQRMTWPLHSPALSAGNIRRLNQHLSVVQGVLHISQSLCGRFIPASAGNTSLVFSVRFIYAFLMVRCLILALMLSFTPVATAQSSYPVENMLTGDGLEPCMLRGCSAYLFRIHDRLADAIARQDQEEIRRWSWSLYEYLDRHPEERPAPAGAHP